MSSDTTCQGKSSWPELLGAEGKVAAATIEKENPLVDARIVPDGSVVPLDFRCDRVWVWVDERGIVSQVPQIG
ncbi:hypothetical protein OIU78_004317 [Salix suchowensis]|uniref:INHIBITOR OF TRYPSIN AND HAGEMAN FACTOR-LIKE PROTEIN n=1 Tax=Salix koriyanagi TaxID=2511006 RepID=A0A9Q0WRR1_9ROSI|nr:potato inhibitor family protein [Salix suchowensis]KAJ6356185.1 hypothetical protein OIU78_004317 [Salix suchowensis]KAJ6771336.1 INHIBITOR OF TRYPSIN AND HAGEMAN FACTOR-LIKE PROTEIN [Salix koriyanagi]